MHINFTKHSIDRCLQRWPNIKNKREAKTFLEITLRNFISERNRWNEKIRQKYFNKYYTITDGEHKIVYIKEQIGELLIITYWYKDEISKLEYSLLKELNVPMRKNGRYYK